MPSAKIPGKLKNMERGALLASEGVRVPRGRTSIQEKRRTGEKKLARLCRKRRPIQ